MSVVKQIAQVLLKQQKRKHRAECRSPVIKPAIVSKRKPDKEKPKRRKKAPPVFQITGKAKMFFVESEDKKVAFKVKWNGNKGVCSCDDYQQNHKGNGYLCSHITAVRDGQKKMSVLAQQSCKKTDDQIYAELSKDFPEDLILIRSDGLRALETIHVINRLNDVLGILNWSWKCSTPVLKNNEYVCAGRLDVYINGRNAYRQQIGSCRINSGDGFNLSHGEAQTGSIQMSLKKAASLFGIGLNQIYRANH